MRHSIDGLRALGLSPANYKLIFTSEDPPAQITRLYNLIRERVQMALSERLSDYKTYAAIDYAWELPISNTAAPVIQYIVQKKLDVETAEAMLRSFGLDISQLFVEKEIDGKRKKVFNPPVFFDVVLPIVKAYANIRAAKLYADRRRDPLLPYLPLKQVPKDRVQCEIVEDIVSTLASWWGYETILRESIAHAVKYGVAIVFPREVWFREQVVAGANDNHAPILKNFRQGIRYTIPHPTRTFWDERHPLSTINTDSGVEWVGFWDVWRWGEILDGPFWNKEKVVRSTDWFTPSQYRTYFEQAYPCTIRIPEPEFIDQSRQGRMILYSPTTTRDASIVITTLYMKIVPYEYGLGNVKVPVWHRFIVAGDDTVLWAEPCPYTPAWFVGYDYDPHSAVQSSISLEAMPFQDAIANLLTNLVLTAKQNMLTIVYYDRNAVSERAITEFQRAGEERYKSISFFSYDGAMLPRLGTDIANAFRVIELPKRSIAELVTTINSLIGIMERVLQVSSTELGSSAPHYQSAEEIRAVVSYSNSRLQYIGAHIDDGIEAWKRQLYNAIVEYWDDDIIANITRFGKREEEALKELGFHLIERGKDSIVVKGSKKAIRIEGFAQAKSVQERERNMQLAAAIYQVVQIVAAKPEIFQAVGVENVIRLVEEAARLSGAPPDFVLRNDKTDVQTDIRTWVMQTVQQGLQMLTEQLGQGVIQPIAQKLSEHEQVMAAMAQTMQEIANAVQEQRRMDADAMVKLQKAMADIQIKAAKAAADTQIKQQMAAMQIKRMQDLHKAEMAIKLAKTAGEVAKQEATEALVEIAGNAAQQGSFEENQQDQMAGEQQ